MKVVEGSGKSIDEAVEGALKELGVARDRVEIEVFEEPSRRFLGILGGRPARVRVSLKETAVERARDFMSRVIEYMGIEAEVSVHKENDLIAMGLEGRNLGILIGRRGETLNALQYLVNLSVNKDQMEREKIVLDIEGYRKKREETLVRLAEKLAEKAKRRGRSVILEPMNPQERRVIHTTLRGRDDIYTFSEGEEPYRKIIIAPRK